METFDGTDAQGECVAFLAKVRGPQEIAYHAIVIGEGHNLRGRSAVREKVKTHIALFETEIEKGTAKTAKHGETLRWAK